jgi:ribosomal protein S27E
MKPCSFCFELIQDNAIKCRFCNEMLTVPAGGGRGQQPQQVVSARQRPQPPHMQMPLGEPQQGQQQPPPPGSQPYSPPGSPARIPIEPRASEIVYGLGLVGLALWMIVAWLPAHRPMSESEHLVLCATQGIQGFEECAAWLTGNYREFNPTLYYCLYIFAALLALGGAQRLIRGATYRAYEEVMCRSCKTMVVGKKAALGIRCPLGDHYAKDKIIRLILLGVLVLILIGLAASAPSN